ncbi:MAG: AarF/ABC1/UbiB kinase family protein, partial [Pseudomonadota bacterium]
MSEPSNKLPSPGSENSFGGRLRRYAQVSGTVAGQAARYAGHRMASRSFDRDVHANELRVAFGGLKGPLMKVAQILATIPDALPPEYAAQLAQLQSNAPPMGKPFGVARMATELGPSWAQEFADFPLEAAAAASLGQVHKATMKDGRAVACKLQYPDIESAVEADLGQLRLIISLYRRYDSAIDPSLIYEEVAERLREEIDYKREARHMRVYREILAEEPGVRVPEVVDYLSTPRLLTMEWLDGEPLLSFKDADREVRNTIALNMFRAWYVPFYGFGVIHGDPHLGNYSVRDDHSINLLDFGCVRIFPP